MNRPKRLQDTSFIDNGIYRKWPPEYKCLWHFINADCDLNGIWLVAFDIAQFTIYGSSNNNDMSIEKAKEHFKCHIVEIENGKRWFIPDFIKTQYNNKLSGSNFHRQITKTLLHYNIDVNKYGITAHPPVPAKNKYPTKDLADPRWKKKRNSILKRDNFECQMCQGEEMLDVHHKLYIDGHRLWEYEDKDLITVCKSCHSEEHTIIRKRIRHRESVVI